MDTIFVLFLAHGAAHPETEESSDRSFPDPREVVKLHPLLFSFYIVIR